jgi:hypothetical protein
MSNHVIRVLLALTRRSSGRQPHLVSQNEGYSHQSIHGETGTQAKYLVILASPFCAKCTRLLQRMKLGSIPPTTSGTWMRPSSHNLLVIPACVPPRSEGIKSTVNRWCLEEAFITQGSRLAIMRFLEVIIAANHIRYFKGDRGGVEYQIRNLIN